MLCPEISQSRTFKEVMLHSFIGTRAQWTGAVFCDSDSCRCEFSGTCCIRRQKIVTDSFILSFGFGVVMCWNMILPVSPKAHSYCFLVFSIEVGTSGCGDWA